MEHLLYQAIFGLIVGVIAKFLTPGRDPGGCIITMLLGIAGSVLFGWLARNFFPSIGILGHWGGAIAGAVLILLLYRMAFGESKS